MCVYIYICICASVCVCVCVCLCVCVYIHTYMIMRALLAQPEAPRLCQKRPIEIKNKHRKETYINQKRTFVVPHVRQNMPKETNANPDRPYKETYKRDV